MAQRLERIKKTIGCIPNFPKEGIIFRDIFPVCQNPEIFGDLIDIFVEHLQQKHEKIDVVVGLEARGFLFGPILAQRLKCSFVPIRKKGKLPGECIQVSYELEYGTDIFEAQKSAIKKDQKVIIVDDLLATGGTMKAACDLVDKMSGKVLECLVAIELTDLKGRDKVPYPLKSFTSFDGH